jgi:hypothetical protein
MPGEIGDRLTPGAAGNQGVINAGLGRGKNVFGMGIEPGPVLIEDVGQQYLAVQAGRIAASGGQGLGSTFQDLRQRTA